MTPRKPTYRSPYMVPVKPWERLVFAADYEPRHRLGLFTPVEETVAALRERHGREA